MRIHSLEMRLLLGIFLGLIAATSGFEADCNIHVQDVCTRPGSLWAQGSCNSLFGGYKANEPNLNVFLNHHLQDSFKYALMASYFSRDVVNRHGIHKLLMDHSDKMWGQGKKLLHYMLKRGSRFTNSTGTGAKLFTLDSENVGDYEGEVKSLSVALDMMKQQATDAIKVYRHATHKMALSDANGQEHSYDPGLAHFIQEDFLDDYTNDIRELAGHLNILGKIVKHDSTRNMGLHLFDTHLA